ncbi:MAG: type IV pilus secretin PilQ [Polyangiaceae bacterium]|nr:type IV pilus secretin PilQ [Polyangiaceae bacterium]
MRTHWVRRCTEAASRGALRRRVRRAAAALGVWILTAFVAVSASAQPGATKVTDVALSSAKAGSAQIVVRTSARPVYTARIADGGKRILIDVSGSSVAGAPAAIVEGNDVVAGVMTQAYKESSTTRILVQLAKNATYSISASDTGLVLDLVQAEKTGPAAAVRKEPEKAPETRPAKDSANIRDVRYGFASDRDRIVIEGASDAKFTETRTKSGLRIEIQGARLPKSLQRTLDVGAFGGSVRAISTFQKQGATDVVVVDIDRAAGAKHVIAREGDALVCTLSKNLSSSELGKASDGGAARKTKTVAREEAYELPVVETSLGDAVERTVEPDRADAFLPGMAPQVGGQNNPDAGRAAVGRRIDLDLKDADIHDVLRLLSDVGRVNVVTADNVTGSVTIRMRNVPWDQAMETVLQAKGLGMVRRGNLIRVAPLADLNKERELALARRKSEFELAPLETRLVPVSYADAKAVMPRAKDLLSPRGTVAVDERTNVLILRDITGNLNQVEELVRSLDTQTPQVLIEARIVEASSQFSREFGIQWGGGSVIGQDTGVDTGLAFPNRIGILGAADDAQTPSDGLDPNRNTVESPNFAVNLPAAVGGGTGGALGMTFGSVNNLFNLSVRLSAAESNGTVRIISSPRVLTLDNREARISTGTLIPFSQVSAQGVQTVFQEAKLQLLVKPHVTADGSVSMSVKINRDEPDFGNRSARGDPTIFKREVETELLVMDGHTAVIGGIYTRNTSRSIAQVPVLGDIPILGVLFQRRGSTDRRTELVVFITPRIVNRSESLGR